MAVTVPLLMLITDELTRKGIAVVDELLRRFDSDQITLGELETGVDAIWKTVSGLSDRQLIEVIEAADELVQQYTKAGMSRFSRAHSEQSLKGKFS